MHDAASMERTRSALSHLDPNCDRDTWVKYGMCLKHEYGDAGFDIWDAWSSQSDKYAASDAKSTWKSMRADGKRTIASLFYDAKQAGWKDDGVTKRPSASEIAERKAAAAARAALAAEEEAKEHAEAALRAKAIWDAAVPFDTHPYLDRKGVLSHGLRVGRWERVDPDTGEVYVVTDKGLLIPIRDRQRNICSLQCIHPDASKKKLYLKGGAKRGNFFPIGAKPLLHEGKNVFLLGEGYATCASAHEATGHIVLVCFDVSNLAPVAHALRERLPDAIILFLADNDTEVDGNPGVTIARKVAKDVGGLVAVPPPGDFNDLQAAEGGEAVAAVINAALSAPAPEPEPEDPPTDVPAEPAAAQPALPVDAGDDDALADQGHFSILGYDSGDYYFFHHQKRQVIVRSRNDFSDIGLVELAPLNWWEMFFPSTNNKGRMDRLMAFEWVSNVAHKRGIYDPKRIRGRGAWRDNGRVVFHHGDYLSVDGSRVEIAEIDSRWVYPMSHSMPAPAAQCATDAEGQYLINVAKLARWSRPGSAALMAGWVFLSPICGALPWRPHVWLTGQAGSGKSTIQSEYVQVLLHGIAEHFQGDSTEAGIRQTLKADAVPALIDEFEPNDEADRKRMKGVLTMMRQASSESSAQTVKGTVSGDGMKFHIRSMFCLASVNTMLDKDSDQSRITALVLRPQAKSGSSDDQWQQLEEDLHKIGKDGQWPARLLARALTLLPTILANVEVFCRAAAQRFGTQRAGDQYGTLLAGAWSLSSSAVATEAQAQAMIDSFDWSEHKESGDGLDDPAKALASVMEARVKVPGGEVSIYEVLAEASGRAVGHTKLGIDTCADILLRNGIRIIANDAVFANASKALRKLVEDTPYATDLRGQLRRLPGAHPCGNKTHKFAGVTSKVVAVPLALILDDDQPPI